MEYCFKRLYNPLAWWTYYSFIAPKWEIIFAPCPQNLSLLKTPTEGIQRHQRPHTIWLKTKFCLILLQKTKTNRTIAFYRRYCCFCILTRSLHLLSPLVFTVAALGISLFQAPERQYRSSERIKFSHIFQGLALSLQTP